MDAGSAAAYFAGSVVLRKTFEAVAQRSLSSIFSTLHSRFRGQNQLRNLQKDLESRLQVLSLPVDMCIQHVLHGNTALEGALDMVIHLITDIVCFQEELESQSYNETVSKVSQTEAVRRLEGFLSRLDTILPYLALAVNAVSLLRTTHPQLSPSRLMEASHLIRTADKADGVVLNMYVKLHRFETRLTLPRWQEKMLRCHMSLRQSKNEPINNGLQEFELFIINENSSEAEEETPLCFSVDKIAALGSSTLHVLGLGEHNLEAVLLIDLGSSKTLMHLALQCIDDQIEKADHVSESKSNRSSSSEDEEDHRDSSHTVVGSVSKISRLGLLEYALRLCMLQSREEREHWHISDERIRMFFADPRFVSEPIAHVSKKKSSHKVGVDVLGGITPSRKNTNDPEAQTPPPSLSTVSGSSRRRLGSLTDMFYDLRFDSPASINRDEA